MPGNRLYGLSSSETLYEWDAATGAVLNSTLLDVGALPQTFAVTGARPDGKLIGITTGGGSNQIRLIDPADHSGTTSLLLDFTFDTGGFYVDSFVVDVASDRFYVASSGPTLYEFSLTTGQVVSTKPMDFTPHAMALLEVPSACGVGDADCDGDVDLDDIISAVGSFTGPCTAGVDCFGDLGEGAPFDKIRANGDVNNGAPVAGILPLQGDGDVDLDDIIDMVGAFTGPLDSEGGFLQSPYHVGVSNSSVPEPSTYVMALLGLSGMAFVGFKRRARS